MSLSQRNLSSIQKAGQAVHGTSQAIATAVLEQAQNMVARVASQPFSAESEQAIARFKLLSGLSQGLIAVEARMQELYAMAGDLASPASDVILLPSIGRRRSASNAAAVDVVAKPAKDAKRLKQARRSPAALTANDTQLLAFLQKKLKAHAALALTGAQMSAGSKLPLGSVGVSLKKLVASGAVKVAGRSQYLLGTGASAPTAVARHPSTAKKPKAAPIKAKPVAAEMSLHKPVKSKAAKRAKPAPGKKPAAVVEVPASVAPVEEQAALV